MLIDMDKSTVAEILSQLLESNNIQFNIAITFPTEYNSIFNVTIKNFKFYFTKLITDDVFVQRNLSPGACELEHLIDGNRRIINEEGHFTEQEYPLTIEPNISTL